MYTEPALHRGVCCGPAGDCAKKGSGLAVIPRKGDALLFWDMHVDGKTVDRASLHASCPTLKVSHTPVSLVPYQSSMTMGRHTSLIVGGAVAIHFNTV